MEHNDNSYACCAVAGAKLIFCFSHQCELIIYTFSTPEGFDGLRATYKQGSPTYFFSLCVKRLLW